MGASAGGSTQLQTSSIEPAGDLFFLVSTTMRGEEQYAAISECVLAEKTGEQLQTVIEQIYPSGDLT